MQNAFKRTPTITNFATEMQGSAAGICPRDLRRIRNVGLSNNKVGAPGANRTAGGVAGGGVPPARGAPPGGPRRRRLPPTRLSSRRYRFLSSHRRGAAPPSGGPPTTAPPPPPTPARKAAAPRPAIDVVGSPHSSAGPYSDEDAVG